MEKSDSEEFYARFKIVCRKCGSENVTMHYEPEVSYSEGSGNSASLSWTCHDRSNDLVIYPH